MSQLANEGWEGERIEKAHTVIRSSLKKQTKVLTCDLQEERTDGGAREAKGHHLKKRSRGNTQKFKGNSGG